MQSNWGWINAAVAAVLGFFLLLKSCNEADLERKFNELELKEHSVEGLHLKRGETVAEISTKTSHKTDTITRTIYKTKVIRHDSLVIVPPPNVVVDTSAIIEKFFTRKLEQYHFVDTNVMMDAWYNVYKNNVAFDSMKYAVFRKTITVTNSVKILEHKMRFGIGMFGSGNKNNVQTFGPCLNISTRKYYGGAGYDVMNRGYFLNAGIVINQK
jgi:hypothetical protein